MGFFGFGKKERVVDLSEKYRREQEEKEINNSKTATKIAEQSPAVENTGGMFGIFNSSLNQPVQSQTQFSASSKISETPESPEEKRRKLMGKFSEMSERLETLSTSLYHLSQRVELLERKIN